MSQHDTLSAPEEEFIHQDNRLEESSIKSDTAPKIKRERKPWVYKSEFDKLSIRYQSMTATAAVGFIGMLIEGIVIALLMFR